MKQTRRVLSPAAMKTNVPVEEIRLMVQIASREKELKAMKVKLKELQEKRHSEDRV